MTKLDKLLDVYIQLEEGLFSRKEYYKDPETGQAVKSRRYKSRTGAVVKGALIGGLLVGRHPVTLLPSVVGGVLGSKSYDKQQKKIKELEAKKATPISKREYKYYWKGGKV
jgi:hypothetical protein